MIVNDGDSCSNPHSTDHLTLQVPIVHHLSLALRAPIVCVLMKKHFDVTVWILENNNVILWHGASAPFSKGGTRLVPITKDTAPFFLQATQLVILLAG